MRQVELAAKRRLMDAYIRAEGLTIRLVRTEKIATAAGGFTLSDPVTLPRQQFRLIPFKRRLTEQSVDTQDGDIRLIPYVLIGRYNVDIEVGDEFDYNSRSYRVVGVEPKAADRTTSDRVVAEMEVR